MVTYGEFEHGLPTIPESSEGSYDPMKEGVYTFRSLYEDTWIKASADSRGNVSVTIELITDLLEKLDYRLVDFKRAW